MAGKEECVANQTRDAVVEQAQRELLAEVDEAFETLAKVQTGELGTCRAGEACRRIKINLKVLQLAPEVIALYKARAATAYLKNQREDLNQDLAQLARELRFLIIDQSRS